MFGKRAFFLQLAHPCKMPGNLSNLATDFLSLKDQTASTHIVVERNMKKRRLWGIYGILIDSECTSILQNTVITNRYSCLLQLKELIDHRDHEQETWSKKTMKSPNSNFQGEFIITSLAIFRQNVPIHQLSKPLPT